MDVTSHYGAARRRIGGAATAAAAAVLALFVGDGSDTPLIDENYPQGTAPGEYRFTPGTPFALRPAGPTSRDSC